MVVEVSELDWDKTSSAERLWDGNEDRDKSADESALNKAWLVSAVVDSGVLGCSITLFYIFV